MHYIEEKDHIDTHKIKTFLQVIAKVIIFIDIFLLPVFFIPATVEFYETAKFVLLGISVLLLSSIFILKVVSSDELIFYKSDIDGTLLLLVGVFFISAIFSISTTTSFLGYVGRGFETPLFFLIHILFLYLVINFLGSEVDIEGIQIASIASGAIIAIIGLLSYTHHIIPVFLSSFIKDNNFSPLVDISVLPYVIIVNIIFCLTLFFSKLYELRTRVLNSIACVIYLLCFLLFTAVIGIYANTGVLITLLVGLLVFCLLQSYVMKRSMLIVLFVFAISCFLGALTISIFKPVHETYVQLPLHFSLSILFSSWHSFKNVLFGAGPDTFYLNFISFVPKSYFGTTLTNVAFTKATNEITQQLITSGLLGTISIIAVYFSSLILSLRIFKHTTDFYSRNILAGITSIFTVLLLTLFLIPLASVLFFLFILAICIVVIEKQVNNVKGKDMLHIKLVVEQYFDNRSVNFKRGLYTGALGIIVIVAILIGYNYKSQMLYYGSLQSRTPKDAYDNALQAYEMEGFNDYYASQFNLASLQIAKQGINEQNNTKDKSTLQSLQTAVNGFRLQAENSAQLQLALHPTNPIDVNANANIFLYIYENIDQNSIYLQNYITRIEYLHALYPNNLQYEDELANGYYLNKAYQKALPLLQDMHSVNGTNAEYAYLYIRTLEASGSYKKAIPLLKSFIEDVHPVGTFASTLATELISDEKATQ